MPRTPTFQNATDTRAKGRIAETAAVRWLRNEGYEVVATNFAVKAGEIDVIAVEPASEADAEPTLCFIEVKARRTANYGPSLAAVTWHKQKRIARVAAAYLAWNGWDGPCRFDVLGMDPGDGKWRFTLIRHAFEAP